MKAKQIASMLAVNLPDELYHEFIWAVRHGKWRCGLPFTEKQR